jgi:hypothetical protein
MAAGTTIIRIVFATHYRPDNRSTAGRPTPRRQLPSRRTRPRRRNRLLAPRNRTATVKADSDFMAKRHTLAQRDKEIRDRLAE